jgi:murein DD-endopeptidase MepM/ murein hydrolase activator NlpD
VRIFRAGLLALLLTAGAGVSPTLAQAAPAPRDQQLSISIPTSPGRIAAKFGQTGSYWGSTPHSGLDFDGDTGDAVFAVAGGVVKEVGMRGSFGRTVTISHGDGLASMYAHPSATEVNVGDQVFAGDRIARMGATGNVSGSHLHLEIQVRGVPTDPYEFLFAANPGKASTPPAWACRIYNC